MIRALLNEATETDRVSTKSLNSLRSRLGSGVRTSLPCADSLVYLALQLFEVDSTLLNSTPLDSTDEKLNELIDPFVGKDRLGGKNRKVCLAHSIARFPLSSAMCVAFLLSPRR